MSYCARCNRTIVIAAYQEFEGGKEFLTCEECHGILTHIRVYKRKYLPYDLEATGNRCVYCGVEFDDQIELTVDHVQPLAQGGGRTRLNLAPCCWRCNQDKRDLTLAEFIDLFQMDRIGIKRRMEAIVEIRKRSDYGRERRT